MMTTLRTIAGSLITASMLLFTSPLKAERVLWPMDTSDRGTTLVGETWFDSFAELPLFPDLHAELANSDPYKLLNRYFLAMSAGDLDSIAPMYAEEDGSRGHFLEQLEKKPDKYEGFRQIEEVDLLGASEWGSYKILYVILKGGAGTVRWRYPMLCTDQCLFSDFLNQLDESNKIYIGAVSDFTRRLGAGSARQLSSDAEASGLPAEQDGVSVLPSYDRKIESPVHPLVFYPVIESVEGKIDLTGEETGVDDALKEIQQLEPFIAFIDEARSLDIASATEDLYPPNVLELFDKHWPGFKKGSVIRAGAGPTHGSANERAMGVYHGPLAYVQKVQNWNGIKVVGLYQSERYGFLYFTAEHNDGSSPVQSVPFIRSHQGWELSLDTQRTVIGSVMQSHEMLRFVQNRAQAD